MRGRKPKWNAQAFIGFKTEQYLKDALEKDPDFKKEPDITQFFNKMILKFLGGNNNAVEQFRGDHPDY